MSRANSQFQHEQLHKTAVLLTNLGTPDAPTTSAVRRYLAEFLWDPRIVELPRVLWWMILRIILLFRPARSAAKYQTVWTDAGSPLLVILQRQARAVEIALADVMDSPPVVAFAMRYGRPGIEATLKQLQADGVTRLLVLPLYPQYSATTTASTFDAVAAAFRSTRWLPDLRFVSHYADRADYISAVATSIKAAWREHPQPERLLFSFHGIPQRYFLDGDPYYCQCQKTARLVAEELALASDEWAVSFQSRLGRTEWLQPYTDVTLEQWGKAGVSSVDVVCPGFSADCLETLEEINQEGRELFTTAGGDQFHYIPALNDDASHIQALVSLIRDNLTNFNSVDDAVTAAERAARAKALETPPYD